MEEYKKFATKRVASCIVSAKSDVLEESDRYHLDKQKVEKSFEKICKLLCELVGIIVQSDCEERYVGIDTQLKSVENCINESFHYAMRCSVKSCIFDAEWNLLDTENEYGFFVDPNHPLIKPHLKKFEEFFTDESDDEGE